MEERHPVITLHAALCRTSSDWLQCCRGMKTIQEEAYVSTSRTKALLGMERDSFVGPHEAVAMERRAFWHG